MNTRGDKVYLEILKQIRMIIDDDGLLPGDKLPSERELSERLNAGRSSVREALRALELLGLIETRRGEGTFIKDSGEHKLIELIGTFILQNEKAKQDLLQTKRMLETAAIVQACMNCKPEQLEELERTLVRAEASSTRTIPIEDKNHFHLLLIEASENQLLKKIWKTIMEYSEVLLTQGPPADITQYRQLLQALKQHQPIEAIEILQKKLY